MATKKDLTKEEKIKREFSRLKRIFKDLDKNKLQTVESLIKNAAFMANTKTAQIRAGRSKATR